MRKIHYSVEFRSHLKALREYLKTEFDKSVAIVVEKDIKNAVENLRTMPGVGVSIGERFGFDTDYLCVYVRQNYICYTYDEEDVYILGMIHEKQQMISAVKRLLKG